MLPILSDISGVTVRTFTNSSILSRIWQTIGVERIGKRQIREILVVGLIIGIEGGDIPLGASVSLFMVPILAVAAAFILRDITKRGSEV